MRSQGMHCVLPMEEFQVMGFIDVFLALPKLIRQFYFIATKIQELKPKAVVMIDYPGFNLRLAKHLRKKVILENSFILFAHLFGPGGRGASV